ncbi:MAG: LysM peptidoglycan-binding domain-containing protein [Clostridiales bacterium]|nr:LysM peptidoglycan-binding domain-containing protein [Clostridiales bacterium]
MSSKIIDNSRFREYRTENRDGKVCRWEDRRAEQQISAVKVKRLRKKNNIKNFIIIVLMVLAFCSGFFGHSLLINAHAEEKTEPGHNRYYTSVQLKKGDSLWNIAKDYADGTGFSTLEYMEELKRLNHLESENIHAGEYLTVVYFN